MIWTFRHLYCAKSNRISPVSGERGNYSIISTDYDYDTEKVVLVFQSDWWALPTGFEDYTETHILKTSLTLCSDGIYRYEYLAQNDVLHKAIEATKGQEAFAELLIELSKE